MAFHPQCSLSELHWVMIRAPENISFIDKLYPLDRIPQEGSAYCWQAAHFILPFPPTSSEVGGTTVDSLTLASTPVSNTGAVVPSPVPSAVMSGTFGTTLAIPEGDGEMQLPPPGEAVGSP